MHLYFDEAMATLRDRSSSSGYHWLLFGVCLVTQFAMNASSQTDPRSGALQLHT